MIKFDVSNSNRSGAAAPMPRSTKGIMWHCRVTLFIEPTRNYPYLGLNRITDPQLPLRAGFFGPKWPLGVPMGYLALMALLEVTLRFKIIVTRGMLFNPPLPSLLETLVALWHRRNGRHQHHFELRRSCSWERGLFIFIFIFQNIKSQPKEEEGSSGTGLLCSRTSAFSK